jgi:regulator of RNase E activity RraA
MGKNMYSYKIDNETKDLINRLSKFYSGVVNDILDDLGIKGFMRGLSLQSALPEEGKIVAPAATVQFKKTTTSRVQWEVHEAIDKAEDHILVIDSDFANGGEGSVFGGLMSTGAKVNGLKGTIVDGTCRDIEEVRKVGYPIYSRGVAPLTAVGRLVSTGLNISIICAGVKVRPGDIIFADLDGVVCVPRKALARVVELGEELFTAENNFEARIKAGDELLDVFAHLSETEEMTHV